MTQKTRIFFHSVDQDGVCSAAIALRAFPDAVLHPVNHGEDLDAKIFSVVGPEDTVIMVDFNMKPVKKLVKLSKQCKTFIWIDHHNDVITESLQDGFQPLGVRADGTAACILTWMYFFDTQELPIGVDLIGKWDVHDLRDERVVPYHFGMDFYDLDPTLSVWDEVFSNEKKVFDRIMNDGILLHAYKKRSKIQKALSYAFDVDLGDYTALAINGSADLDDLVEVGIFDENKHDFLLMFTRYSDMWKFSLRSRRDDVNVAEICKRFKGGGHNRAAGFSTKDEGFISKLIKGKILITRSKEQ